VPTGSFSDRNLNTADATVERVATRTVVREDRRSRVLATGWAHSEQNLAVGEAGALQFGRYGPRGVADCSQNLACGRFSCWQRGQRMPGSP
jgi:hypothetical protein